MVTFFAIVAGLIHLYIFFLESIAWGKPNVNRVFGMSPEVAEQNRALAFNQGFYNLFLAIAIVVGLLIGLDTSVGRTLIVYSLTSMLLAALVLIFSNKKLLRPALIQGVSPFLGLIFLAVSYSK